MTLRTVLILWCLPIVLSMETKAWNKEFDFIVVGAGSAGAVIATRLSELPEVNVLLLEAGGEPPKKTEIPFFSSELWNDPEVDWQLRTESQKHACLGYIKEQSPWARGKLLGGSSSVNAMMFTRGCKQDYDNWASLGNEGWSYKDVLPYFLKLEDYRVPHSKYDAPYHSTDGPVTVTRSTHRTVLAEAFLEAGMEMGYFEVDYNAEIQKGFQVPVFNIRNGKRCGTYEAYLEPNRNRKNLKIETRAFVTKVLVENKAAVGVQFEKDGTLWTAKAKKEVILSAGTPFSPQILMLSGIGPKETLEKFKIPVILDLAGVGQNLQDHLILSGLSFTIEEPVAVNIERDVLNDKVKKQYEEKGTGIFTVPLANEGVAFIDSSSADSSLDFPDIELAFSSTKCFPLNIKPEIIDIISPADPRDFFTVYPIIQHPVSRGYITLRSADPHDPPIMEPLYLTAEEDVKVFLDAVKLTHALVNTTAFQRYGAKYHNQKLPTCETLEGDEYWICFIRHLSMGVFHISGTCKMGPRQDRMAVVDPTLKVHGIKGLRVADASIMPNVITGHTNAPAIMIGEKAADMIKKQWNYRKHDEL